MDLEFPDLTGQAMDRLVQWLRDSFVAGAGNDTTGALEAATRYARERAGFLVGKHWDADKGAWVRAVRPEYRIFEKTRQVIQAKVEAVVAGQASMGELSEDLDSLVGSIAGRALTIARTELAYAYGGGALASYAVDGASVVEVLDGPGCLPYGHSTTKNPAPPPDPDIIGVQIDREANGQRWPLEDAIKLVLAHPNCERAFLPVYGSARKGDFPGHPFRGNQHRRAAESEMASTILSIGGGKRVVVPQGGEADAVEILERGALRPGAKAKFVEGKCNQCHANVAALYKAGKLSAIETGYALSDDGLWRQHTWGNDAGRIVETTELRRKYFGFRLTDEEAEAFVRANPVRKGDFNEADHPRHPAGSEKGGEFAPKGEGDDAFAAWFEGSQIVDKDGKPLVVYHGTEASSDFSEFTPGKPNKTMQLGFGIHFTEDPAFASDHYAAEKGGRVYPVYLRAKNVLDASAIVSEGSKEFKLAKALAGKRMFALADEHGRPSQYLQAAIDMTTPARAERLIREAGYDAVKYMATVARRTVFGFADEAQAMSYIVFEPNQIKSAIGNRGTYDESADIGKADWEEDKHPRGKTKPGTNEGSFAPLKEVVPAPKHGDLVAHGDLLLTELPQYDSDNYVTTPPYTEEDLKEFLDGMDKDDAAHIRMLFRQYLDKNSLHRPDPLRNDELRTAVKVAVGRKVGDKLVSIIQSEAAERGVTLSKHDVWRIIENSQFYKSIDTRWTYASGYGPAVGMAMTLHDQWARTSGDSHEVALALQIAARAALGNKSASDPLRVHRIPLTDDEADETSFGRPTTSRRTVLDLVTKFSTPSEGVDVVRSLIRAEYENTQEWLAKRGIKELKLYRGVIDSYAADSIREAGTGNVATNPLSSWTTSVSIARDFSDSSNVPSKSSVVLEARVPANRIFSLAVTGSGCLPEREAVVIGGRDKVNVYVRDEALRSMVLAGRKAGKVPPPNSDPLTRAIHALTAHEKEIFDSYAYGDHPGKWTTAGLTQLAKDIKKKKYGKLPMSEHMKELLDAVSVGKADDPEDDDEFVDIDSPLADADWPKRTPDTFDDIESATSGELL